MKSVKRVGAIERKGGGLESKDTYSFRGLWY